MSCLHTAIPTPSFFSFWHENPYIPLHFLKMFFILYKLLWYKSIVPWLLKCVGLHRPWAYHVLPRAQPEEVHDISLVRYKSQKPWYNYYVYLIFMILCSTLGMLSYSCCAGFCRAHGVLCGGKKFHGARNFVA